MRKPACAALAFLLLAAFALALPGCAQPLPVFQSSDSSDEFPPVITAPDGVKYLPCDVGQWHLLKPTATGMTDWSKATIYSAKADTRRNVIYYKKSFDDTVVYYAREDFTLPKLDREGIDSVEWVKDEGQAGKNTLTDRSVVDRITDCINGEEGRMQADVPAVEAAKVYLYSSKAPGLTFRIAIWFWNGDYFLINLAHHSVFLDREVVEKLKQGKGK